MFLFINYDVFFFFFFFQAEDGIRDVAVTGVQTCALPILIVELVCDERTFRLASAVSVPGWGMTEPDEAEIARRLQEVVQDLATWSSFRVVAKVDNEPVSTGGCTLVGEVAQLWGA